MSDSDITQSETLIIIIIIIWIYAIFDSCLSIDFYKPTLIYELDFL